MTHNFPPPPASGARTNSRSRELVRPLWRSPRRWRQRILPGARPRRRGREILDPLRYATLNASVASRHGALIRVGGHLVPRCECCFDCGIECAMPKNDIWACGPCTPRSLNVGVVGVEVCGCTYVSDPPSNPRFGTWATLEPSVDGTYCASGEGGAPFYVGGPCLYWALLSAGAAYWLDKLEPFACDVAADGAADGTSTVCALSIEMLAGTPPMLQCRIRTDGITGPFAAVAEIFYGRTEFLGWQRTHIVDNILGSCGIWPADTDPFLEGTWILGHEGQMVIRPCCV
jgi:hypothetical protein